MIHTRHLRIPVQAFFLGLWVLLIYFTRHPIDNALTQVVPISFFLRIDPLVTTVVWGGMRSVITIGLLGLVTLGVTLLLGRVFCGWVCPLGTLFDFYGWFLRRFRFKFEGPSPAWFTFKYYLLVALLVFAVFGGVSPLMGFDPIVLLTRTAAVVFGPLVRQSENLLWNVNSSVGYHGLFVDAATMLLFLGIFGATTKLSRIWCRTACPLGAYLAIASRNSILRRDTKGCIHCNICSAHCPTGAIDFKNPEVYNESECIKCFACSQECPVDANYFTLKSPIPAVSSSQHPVSLERRTFIGTVAGTLAASPVFFLAAGETKSDKRLLRPPMSREERDFLSSCIRCAECMKACPTGVLKPAGLEHGLRALWSPVMVPTEGYCMEGCQACSVACPTDAIMKYPIEKKYAFKAGTAVLNSSLCIGYTENKFCNECIKACPTDAIEWEKGWEPPKGWEVGGADVPAPKGKKPSRPVHVSFEKCIGCGACEFQCNEIVLGEPAMVTTSFGRATPSVLGGEKT